MFTHFLKDGTDALLLVLSYDLLTGNQTLLLAAPESSLRGSGRSAGRAAAGGPAAGH